MFYINPKDFKGCVSKCRIDLEGKTYEPQPRHKRIIFTSIESGNGSYGLWKFDTIENINKAIEKIDSKVCHRFNERKIPKVKKEDLRRGK